MASIPTIKLAKPKNRKDFVIANRDGNEEQIAAFKKQGFTEEVSIDGNEMTPGAEEEAPEVGKEEPAAKPKKKGKEEPAVEEPKN